MTIRTRPKMLLILGAGWTSTFLIPLLKSLSISYAATTTTGRDKTIKFIFDPDSTDPEPYKALPDADAVLITFPLKGVGQSTRLTQLYESTHPRSSSSSSSSSSTTTGDSPKDHPQRRQWIQLGSTGIFTAPHWNDHTAPYDTSDPRAMAEDELLSLGGCVLNLAGLYGGVRDVRHWLPRVARSKEDVRAKKALHMVHGEDVARGIVAVVRRAGEEDEEGGGGGDSNTSGGADGGVTTWGKRWLLTDLHVYCWWDLFMEWGREREEAVAAAAAAAVAGTGADEKEKEKEGEGEGNESPEFKYRQWVLECMEEEGVRALPRDAESLGRVLDSRAFWSTMGIWPSQGSIR